MRWLQSTYTIRLNHRHKLFGHVLRGRDKALLVDGSGDGYLKTVCDYVHLCAGGVARASPHWFRVDRLLGAHGLKEDTAESQQEFQARIRGAPPPGGG